MERTSASSLPGDRDAGPRRLAIRDGRSVRFIDPGDVLRIVSAETGVVVHTAGSAFPWRESLARVAERIHRSGFVRVHRGALVNARRVVEVRARPGGECAVLLDDGTVVGASRGFRDVLAEVEAVTGSGRV